MTTYLDRSVDEAIDWMVGQITHPTPPAGQSDWSGLCQASCRMAYGIAPWPYPHGLSAIGAWQFIPEEFKHRNGHPSKAKRGEILYYAGGTFGHAALAAGKSTDTKCLSVDWAEQGEIGWAPRTFPGWGNLTYVGSSAWTPYGIMRVDVAPVRAWDGVVPQTEGVFTALNDSTLANPAAWRLACRLDDLGFYAGAPLDKLEQKYPAKAVANFQKSLGMKANPLGAYSPHLHDLIFS